MSEHEGRQLLSPTDFSSDTTSLKSHYSNVQQEDNEHQTQQQQYSQADKLKHFQVPFEELKQNNHGQEQQYNLNFNENNGSKEEADTGKVQHCALEIFTSISQHVNDAAVDFNTISEDTNKIVSMTQATQSLKIDHVLKPLAKNGPNENVCLGGMPNFQVPVSVGEYSEQLGESNFSNKDESRKRSQLDADSEKSLMVSVSKDAGGIDSEEVSLPLISLKDNHKCPCNDDFDRHGLNNVKKYVCGSCCSKFISICLLHQHLEVHGSGGSYHFDNISCTAFPKCETFCSFTQTESEYLIRSDESVEIKDTSSSGEVKVPLKDIQYSGNIHSSNPQDLEQKKPALSRHRRKQINPKPIKLRVTCQRKCEKTRKSRSKIERKERINSEVHIKNKGKNEGPKDDMVDPDIVETARKIKQPNSKRDHSETFTKEDSAIKNTCKEKSDRSENIGVIRPFKKRGRPRKTESLNESRLVKRRRIMKKNKNVGNRDQEHGSNNENIQENDKSGKKEEIKKTEAECQSVDVQNFKSGPDVVEVKQKVHKNAGKYEMCDVCGLPVPKYNYAYHMRKHTGEKPYVCDKCGKAFAHCRFLVKHMLIHVEDKPWKCDLCSAQFCQKTEYSMHMNAHQGNRPHECRVCGLKFLSKGMLNTHQANVHMGITRFECEVCNRRFFKRSSLNVHQATHYEATMKCHFCDRMFKDKAGLKRHERIHTGEKRFRCHICNHEFIQSTPYWVHMEKRHQMDRESVKNMLKDIRETNKRHGIPTEINVLPNDVDHLLVAQENSETKQKPSKPVRKNISEESNENLKSMDNLKECDNLSSQSSFQLPNSEVDARNIGPIKSYTNIKVPNFSTSNVPVMSTYTSVDNNQSHSLQQHFRYVYSSQEPDIHTTACGPSSAPLQEVTSSNSGSLGLPANIPVPVSLASLGLPMNPLNQGFIGLTSLQQPSDYSSSLPPT